MGVTRILDLIVIILLATVILMPRPDASVKPGLTVDPERRGGVAELQSMLIGKPDAVFTMTEDFKVPASWTDIVPTGRWRR